MRSETRRLRIELVHLLLFAGESVCFWRYATRFCGEIGRGLVVDIFFVFTSTSPGKMGVRCCNEIILSRCYSNVSLDWSESGRMRLRIRFASYFS